MDRNQKITREELRQIRSLEDFDLTMLISEIHDHGWPQAKKLLPMIVFANEQDGRRKAQGQPS